MVPEAVHPLEHDVGAVRHHLRPALAAGARHGCFHQPEVPAGVVRPDVEDVAVVVDVVLLLRDPRGHEPPLPERLVRGQEAGLAGGEAGDAEDEVGEAARPVDADVERQVRLLVDEVVRVIPDAVPVEPVLPLGGLLLHRVEERPVVGGPGHRADLLRDRLHELPGAQVLDEERVLPEPGVVGRVGEEARVVAHLVGPEGHEGLPLRQAVEVEGHLLGGLQAPLLPAVDGVLLPLLRARVVEEAALAVGHVRVGLLDAAEHLRVEGRLAGLRGLHHRVGVGVLRLEVGPDLRVLLLAQPVVVVDAALAVDLARPRKDPGHRRPRGRVVGRRHRPQTFR